MSEYITNWVDPVTDRTHIKERIVRCRDCRFHGMKFENSCEHPHALTGKELLHVEPDGFCAWGKRVEQ